MLLFQYRPKAVLDTARGRILGLHCGEATSEELGQRIILSDPVGKLR